MNYASMTNARLAQELETVMNEWHSACDSVYALTIDRCNERLSEILARLGPDNAAVSAYHKASGRRNQVEAECRLRLGNMPSVSFSAYLSKSPRYVREKIVSAA